MASRSAELEAAGVGVRPEQGRAAVRGGIGLEALEDFLGVVQHRRGRIQRERRTRLDPRVVPARGSE